MQLSLAQKTHLTGAVVVSTPQDIALLDARKGIDMFKQLKTLLLGMIENMSTHVCSNCGHEEHVFGHGGVAAEAEKLGVPLLAEIPLSLDIRVASDGGVPIVVSQPESAQAKAFHQAAAALIEKVLRVSIEPTFPPLLNGVKCEVGQAPFDKALMMAAQGCDAGTIVYQVSAKTLPLAWSLPLMSNC